jgi:hypothetical protein
MLHGLASNEGEEENLSNEVLNRHILERTVTGLLAPQNTVPISLSRTGGERHEFH